MPRLPISRGSQDFLASVLVLPILSGTLYGIVLSLFFLHDHYWVYTFCFQYLNWEIIYGTGYVFSLLFKRVHWPTLSAQRINLTAKAAWVTSGLVLGNFLSNELSGLLWQQKVLTSGVMAWQVLHGGVTLGCYYFLAHNRLQKIQLTSLREANFESQYQSLKQQMNPHFLFNSLNSLSELMESDPKKAQCMLQELSDLYRNISGTSESKTVPLHEELGIITKYLAMEKLRFGDRLEYGFSIPQNFHAIKVPTLMVQTLVENAVKHGVAPAMAGDYIKVSVKAGVSNGVLFSVENSGCPASRIALSS